MTSHTTDYKHGSVLGYIMLLMMRIL